MTHPRVGIGLFVLNEKDEFLIGLRKGSHGAGTWGLPGGHLELNESFELCAARELAEETSLVVPEESVEFLTATNSVRMDGREDKHYVTVFMTCRVDAETATGVRVLEEEKCEAWEWVTWEEMAGVMRGVEGEEGEGEKRFFEPLWRLVGQRPGIRPWAAVMGMK